MRLALFTLLLSILLACLPDAVAQEASATPAKAAITILYDARFELHDTGPDHPEQAPRVSAIVERLQHSASLKPWLRWPTFSAATRTDLLRVHSPAYLDLLDAEQARVKPGEQRPLSTGDTIISAHSVAVAMLASGAGMAGVDAVMTQPTPVAFALVRPPGHHATRERGMGFCLTNHIAVAARYAQQHYAIQRILIVDIDVHHGNGTQAIFEADNSVFYFSAHQHRCTLGVVAPQSKGWGLALAIR